MNNSRTMPSLLIAICSLGLILTACNGTESASDTRADVADARAEGRQEVAEERRDASDNLIEAQQDAAKADAALMKESNQGARDIALAQAEASHRVSIEKCEAMTDDMRAACKDSADSDLERAKTLN